LKVDGHIVQGIEQSMAAQYVIDIPRPWFFHTITHACTVHTRMYCLAAISQLKLG